MSNKPFPDQAMKYQHVAALPIFGRERDVDKLAPWLGEPNSQVLALIGPPGVGKTRLAVHLGECGLKSGEVREVRFCDYIVNEDSGYRLQPGFCFRWSDTS